MSLRSRLVLSLCVVAGSAGTITVVAAEIVPATPIQTTSPAAKSLAALVDAFNQHDAQTLAAQWKPDAILVIRPGGVKLAGREALAKAYEDLFKNAPRAKLAIHILDERAITPTVASVDCYADVRHSNGQVTRSEVSAILVEENGKWLIDQVEEAEIALPSAAAAHLSQLDWLRGRWTDKLHDGQIVNDIRSSENGHYIVRDYRQEEKGVTTRAGMQVIAWDAEHQTLRSWLFDASGAFGEGAWRQASPSKWTSTMAVVLPDGRRGSMTQVFEQADDGKLTIQTIDRDVDGAPQPNSEVVSLERTGSADK